MLIEIREWLMCLAELYICWILTKEYFYDFQKDVEKKQKRTRTTKKVTQTKDGATVTEEATEVSEPMNQGELK